MFLMSDSTILTSSVRLLSIGDQVGTGSYRVHSRYTTCLNLLEETRLITCAEPTVQAGPINIILAGFDVTQIHQMIIRKKQLVINREWCLPISDEVTFDSGVDLHDAPIAHLEKNLLVAQAALLELAPTESLAFIFDRNRGRHFSSAFDIALFQQVMAGVETMQQGDFLGGVGMLKGVGIGLTPAGDDFIAGMLFGVYLLQQMHQIDLSSLRRTICARAQGSNLLSNTFLALARQGRFSASFKAFVSALARSDAAQVSTMMQPVLALGSTSGADLLCGLLFTLMTLKDQLLGCPERAEHRSPG